MHRLNLTEKPSTGIEIPLGIFDGHQMLVQEACPLTENPLSSLRSLWRFVQRYGLFNLRRMKGIMSHKAVPNFERLYREMYEGRAFSRPEQLLDVLGKDCNELTQHSARQWLRDDAGGGLSKLVIDELITSGMRANYGGQSCDSLHSFVGLVSIAGGVASRCFAVAGGNQQIPQGLMREARPDHLLQPATAHTLRRSDDNLWTIQVEELTQERETMKGTELQHTPESTKELGPFDIVALCHPLERSCMKVQGAVSPALQANFVKMKTEKFRRCCTHFVSGRLNSSFFGDPVSMEVLTTENCDSGFYSIGLQLPVDVDDATEAQELVDAALDGQMARFKVRSCL